MVIFSFMLVTIFCIIIRNAAPGGQQRSSGSVFSFKLDERAEKRKEVE